MAQGMFDLLNPPQADPYDEQARAMRDRAFQYARLTPREQIGFQKSMGEQRVGQGVAELVRQGVGAATGADVSTPQQKMAAVRAKVQQALRGANMNDPEAVYPVLISALREAGLVPQAMAAVKEFEEITNKRRDDARLTKAAESKAANDAARTEIAGRGTQLAQNIEALGNLYKARDAAPADSPTRAAIEHRIQIMEDSLTKRNIQIKDAGNALEVYIDGVYQSSRPKGVDPTAVAKAASDAKTGGEKISGEIADKLATATGRLSEYHRLSGTFKPEYASAGLVAAAGAASGFSDLTNRLKAVGASNPKERAAAAWWNELALQIMKVRHDIFGATLTAGETQAFDAVRPLLGLPPQVVAQRLQSMRDEAHRELRSRVRGQAARGANVSEFERMIDEIGVDRKPGTPSPAPAPAAAAAPAAGLPSADAIDAELRRRGL